MWWQIAFGFVGAVVLHATWQMYLARKERLKREKEDEEIYG